MLTIGVGVGVGFESAKGSSVSIPTISAAPVISGNTIVNQTLSTTDGTWTGSPSSFTYQWKRAGVNIGSATNNTYVLVMADSGTAITCAVTAINGAGSSSPSTSNSLTIFDPLSLTPALWIDPSDTTTMFQSNAGTTTVTDASVCGYAGDKSGNAFNLTSIADDTTRPTWNNNGGLPYLNFSAASLTLLTKASGLNLLGASSVFIAVRGNPAVSTILFGEADSAGGPTRLDLFRVNGATTSTADMLARNAASSIWFAAGTMTQTLAFNNTDRVYGIVDNGSTFAPYLDGVAGTAQAYTATGTNTTSRTNLGKLWTNANQAGDFTGRVYGLVAVKRAITAGERANLVTYLGAKMGLTL